MRTLGQWVGLAIVVAISIFHPFGLHFADWGQPITATDLAFYFMAFYFIINIASREAANYVVKTLKGKV